MVEMMTHRQQMNVLSMLNSPDEFNTHFLKRYPYWGKQRQVCQALMDGKKTILVPSGNATGKSWMTAGLALWYLTTRPDAVIVTTAPTFDQLSNVLWRAIWGAWNKLPVPLFASRTTRAPLLIENQTLGGYCIGISSSTVEAASGHHAENLLVLIDEASGVEADRIEALNSLNPSQVLMIGNPLVPDGIFYERCQRQIFDPHPDTELIRIRSDQTPPVLAGVQRSKTGLADLDFLDRARRDYGEGSAWWLSHVEAQFPDSVEGQLFEVSWLDEAIYGKPPERRSGQRWLGADIAAGRGGDCSVILVRDDAGIIEVFDSNTMPITELAVKVAHMAAKHEVEPDHIVFDGTGIGETFGAMLESNGIRGAVRFQGGRGTSKQYENWRAASYFNLRRRMNPAISPTMFHIGREYGQRLRREMLATTFELTNKDKSKIIAKDDIVARIGASPDWADSLSMTFAFIQDL